MLTDLELSLYDAAGILGVSLYLGAYGALQLGWLKANANLYTWLNLVAAAMVLISLINDFNLFSAVIQGSWILFSVVGLARRWLARKRLSFTAEEEAMLADRFPFLAPLLASRLTRRGQWEDHAPGTVLATEGQELGKLIYLASGGAEVHRAGRRVAQLQPGDFIGEMTVLHGGPATATVVAMGPVRTFAIDRAPLLALVNAEHEIALEISAAFQRESNRKISRANDALGGAATA